MVWGVRNFKGLPFDAQGTFLLEQFEIEALGLKGVKA